MMNEAVKELRQLKGRRRELLERNSNKSIIITGTLNLTVGLWS